MKNEYTKIDKMFEKMSRECAESMNGTQAKRKENVVKGTKKNKNTTKR